MKEASEVGPEPTKLFVRMKTSYYRIVGEDGEELERPPFCEFVVDSRMNVYTIDQHGALELQRSAKVEWIRNPKTGAFIGKFV